MPNTEFIQEKETQNTDVSVSNYLKVFLLYSCPVCRRYTIHKARFDEEGMWFIDHKRVPLYQMAIDGSNHLVGFHATDYCFIPGVHPTANIETTRTVIRVK